MVQESALTNRALRNRLLERGESLIGFVGLMTAAILLAIVGAAAWWSMRGQQDAWQFVRDQQIKTLANVLSHSSEAMLADNDLSALRRLMVEARQSNELTTCSVVLPDGKIVADADPTKITELTVPAKWPSGTVDVAMQDNSDADKNAISINQPLLVRGRGSATLRISAPSMTLYARLWETAAGIGLIGAAGLAGMLIVYRHMRTRVMTLGLIRESLLAAQDSTVSRSALGLRTDLGPEATAWNKLLEESENLRKTSIAEKVKESLGNRREARSDLEHACDALSVGMIVVDEKSRVKHANGAAAVLLQTKRDQMHGEAIEKFIDDSSLREVIVAIAGGSGQRRTVEIRRSEEQGGGILRLHVRPVRRDDSGGAALVTIEDITQQRVADAARNSFVAQATHELRTPLTNMRLCLENALEEKETDPAVLLNHFNVLNQETRRLERMVGEMLSVAQIEAGSLNLQRDDVRLDKVFEELKSDYQPQAADKKIALKFELPPKFPVIQGDRDKLMVALHNLIGNALKYTPENGGVTVTVRTETSGLTVEVTDTGIGISPEDQGRLFQKFSRAKDPRVEKITGTGLGLALAREIARLHGGDVVLQSELNKGSTFTLSLPSAVQAKAA